MNKTKSGIVVPFDCEEMNIQELTKEQKFATFLEKLSAFLKEQNGAIGVEKIKEKDGTTSYEMNVRVDDSQIALRLNEDVDSIWFTSKVLDHINNIFKNFGTVEEKDENDG